MYDEDGYIKIYPENDISEKRTWDDAFYRDLLLGRTNKNTIDTQVSSIQEVYKGNPYNLGAYTETIDETSSIHYYNELNLMQNIIATKQGEYTDLDLTPSDIEILNNEDKEKAQTLMSFLKHYTDNPKFKKVINDTIFQSLLFPMGITWIKYDYGLSNFTTSNGTPVNGDIDFQNIPLPQFFWDPASTDLDLVGYIIITEETSINALYNNMNFARILDSYHEIRTKEAQSEYQQALQYEQAQNYRGTKIDIPTPDFNLIKKLDSTQTEYMGVYDVQNGYILNRWDNKISNDRVVLYHYFKQNRSGGIDYEIRTDAFFYAGAEILLYREENYCKKYPIATLVYNNLPQSLTGYSLGMQLYKLQGALYEAAINETYANNIASKIILLTAKIGINAQALKSAFVDAAQNVDVDKAALVSEAERTDNQQISGNVHLFDTTKQAIAATSRTNNILQQMMELSGIGIQNSSNSGKSMTTGKGISSLQERGLKVENVFTSNIEYFVQKVYDIMTMYIQDKFTARTLPISYNKDNQQPNNMITEEDNGNGGLVNSLNNTYLKPKVDIMSQSPANKVKNTNLMGVLLPLLAQNEATQYSDISPIINKVTGDNKFANAISEMLSSGRQHQLAMTRLLNDSAARAKIAERQEESKGRLFVEALKQFNQTEEESQQNKSETIKGSTKNG